jgi:hypothetical protein
MALLTAAFLAIAALVSPQDTPVVNARLSTGVARMGSDVSLVVEIQGSKDATLGDLPLVSGLHFGAVQGPQMAFRQESQGGRRMRTVFSVTWIVPVKADRTGTYTIPPFAVNTGGRNLSTPELTLKVVDDLKGEELGYFQIDAPKEIVEGQPFTLELRFGYDNALGEIGDQVNYINLSLPWLDQLPGLLELDAPASASGAGWVKGIVLNSRGTTNAERIPPRTENGRSFLLMRIKKRYLATRAGKLEFPTSHLEFGQVENSIFNLGPSEKHTYYKRVAAFAIEVLELPEEGRPLDFTGAVGAISANATVDRRDVDAGDSIKVAVEWTGEGNLEFFDPPDPSRLDAFKSFRLYGTNDRKTTDRRIVTYDLAPISPDVHTIPPIPLVVFDPSKKAYSTVATDPFPIRVRALKNALGLAAEAARPEPGLDIKDIQTVPERERDPSAPGGGAIAGTLLSIPILWLGLRTAVRRRGDPDAPIARARRAARRALKRDLAQAKTASEQARCLQRFLAARTGEAPQAWVGRDPLAWMRAVSSSVDARTAPSSAPKGFSEEQARALRDLMAKLDERAWARGDEALDVGSIERTADALIRGGL